MRMQETNLDFKYEMSQADVAKAMFLHINTVASTEKRAIEKFKQGMAERGYIVTDYLGD